MTFFESVALLLSAFYVVIAFNFWSRKIGKIDQRRVNRPRRATPLKERRQAVIDYKERACLEVDRRKQQRPFWSVFDMLGNVAVLIACHMTAFLLIATETDEILFSGNVETLNAVVWFFVYDLSNELTVGLVDILILVTSSLTVQQLSDDANWTFHLSLFLFRAVIVVIVIEKIIEFYLDANSGYLLSNKQLKRVCKADVDDLLTELNENYFDP